jgi:3-oxoacyl-[acyl-carrier protein] reductase
MNLSLLNRTAVISGGSKGIGFATARELSLLGAHCILLARNRDGLEAAVADLDAAQNQRHHFYVVDVLDTAALKTTAEEIIQNHQVDIVVNNSGGPAGGPLLDATDEALLDTFKQHIIAAHTLAQVFIPGMKERGFGRIIQVISTSVKTPLHNLGVSNTIRAAMAGWSKTLANEMAHLGITVNNILPGATLTERLGGLIEKQASAQNRPVHEVEDEWKASIPVKRFGLPEEVAAVAAFLATPAAAYVNGVSIAVDGGRTPTLS